MLDSTSPLRYHIAQNTALILTSVIFLPLSTIILLLSYILRPFLTAQNAQRRRSLRSPTFKQRTILITGVGMTKGLVLARAFHLAGHNVIGADFEPYHIPVSGRFSVSLQKFYTLPQPTVSEGAANYIHSLLHIVRREKIDLWISCSGVASAIEDGQAQEVLSRRSECMCIQFSASATQTLHSKDTFIQQTLALGLPVPETHNVISREAVHKVLSQSPRTKKRYIMKSVGVDDANRGDMTILPQRTLSQTYNHVSRIPISDQKPWVLQQYIGGGMEYCTHALIIMGEVKIFVACPSSEMLMHYEALPRDSSLRKAMLRFTQEFASRMQAKGKGMTGHLSFDFLVEEVVSETGTETRLIPIECNPRAHTAVVLFGEEDGKRVCEAYLSALEGASRVNDRPEGRINDTPEAKSNGLTIQTSSLELNETLIVTPTNPARYYWLPHDLITLVLLPTFSLVLALLPSTAHQQPPRPSIQVSLNTLISNTNTFTTHLLFWHEGTYALYDPLPFWWACCVYWPSVFAVRLIQLLGLVGQGKGKSSRVNISTGKVFRC